MDVRITWAPKTRASLVSWVDGKELIKPKPASVFVGSGKIEFEYPSARPTDFCTFEWVLLFPEKTLHDLVVKVSWDGTTWHTVDAHPKDIQHKWTSFGVAP